MTPLALYVGIIKVRMKVVNVMNVELLRTFGLVLFADLSVVSMSKHSETLHNNRYKVE